MDKRRLIAGLLCLAAGLALAFLPQELFPWLPGSQAAGIVLGLSGLMFLARARQIRQDAPAAGSAAAAKPARGGRRRRKKA